MALIIEILKKYEFKIIRIVILIIVFWANNIRAQTGKKNVTITTSGSGNTIEEAQQSALRSAIEQAFGAFISSKTEIFNDKIVADQLVSVSSGNIQSYDVLVKDQLPDGRWALTIKTNVSIDKLTSFVKAKGITIEIKGGLFALNIKQQLLNEQGEIRAVAEMVGLLHEPMQISFDYTIKSRDPKSLDEESMNWEIPLSVTATCNKNIDICANYFRKTLSALSLTPDDINSYRSLNKKIFPVYFKYKGEDIIFYLRRQNSINAIKSLISNWNFYTRLFSIQTGMDELVGISNFRGSLFKLRDSDRFGRLVVTFPTEGNIAGTFNWNDKRTLNQIEQMTSYGVKPIGVISKFKNGGFLVWEKNGHGLVAALCDLGKYNLTDAKLACEKLDLNGYSDWYLPTEDDLHALYTNLCHIGIADCSKAVGYWSSSVGSFGPRAYSLISGVSYSEIGERKLYVRPVRSF